MHKALAKYPYSQKIKNQSVERTSDAKSNGSIRDKYQSYTPRKRYIKEQEQFDYYRNQNIDQAPINYVNQSRCNENSNLYHSRAKKYEEKRKSMCETFNPNQCNLENYPSENTKVKYPFEISESYEPLSDCTASLNNPSSVRKNKFKNYLQNKQVCRKIAFDEPEAKDKSNIYKPRAKRNHQNQNENVNVQNQLCLTPRRLNGKRVADQSIYMGEKISLIQSKIAKLQRMTPKRYSTPNKTSRIIQNSFVETNPQQLQRQDSRIQNVISSRVSVVSQKQHQIMSRVSLGRLVEEQECQTDIEMIQDLSYKISSKLQSIIRNFG